jgi:hypothetical protein
LPLEEIAKGEINSSWYPRLEYAQIPVEYQEAASKNVLKEYLLALARGSWAVSNEWNELLPSFKFTDAKEYLAKAWETAA